MPVFSGRLRDISRDELPRPWDLAFRPIPITAILFPYQICNYPLSKGIALAPNPASRRNLQGLSLRPRLRGLTIRLSAAWRRRKPSRLCAQQGRYGQCCQFRCQGRKTEDCCRERQTYGQAGAYARIVFRHVLRRLPGDDDRWGLQLRHPKTHLGKTPLIPNSSTSPPHHHLKML